MLLLMPFMASAQTSSINAYSPYSMYGLGELLTPGSAQMRSMGGVGIAVRNYGEINVLNPAAASIAPQKSFLFDVGFDGTFFYNQQPKYDANGIKTFDAVTAYTAANIHSIALTFPLAKSVGLSFSIAPYSSVGYKVKTTDENEDTWADIGRVRYGHDGEGDISQVKLSLGWAPWQKFSVGVAAKYYWGSVIRSYEATATNIITGSGVYASTKGVDNYVVSNIKFQLGLQWSPLQTETKNFTLGATYDFGGKLHPEKKSYVYTDNVINSIKENPIRQRIDALELRVPHEFGVGMFFRNRKLAWGADYVYASWGGDNSGYAENTTPSTIDVRYVDTHTVKLGFEFTPRANDVRSYLNRIAYRVGVRAGNYYQSFGGEKINTFAVSAGFGMPLKIWGISTMNIGFEYGRMSSKNSIQLDAERVGLVKQESFKITLGFSLFSADTADYWFVQQKYD